MKIIRLKLVKNRLTRILLSQILLLPTFGFAQQSIKPYRLTLQQAISLGGSANNLVKAAQSEESAASADLSDSKMAALPSIFAGGDYQRFSSLTLYNSFLGGAHAVPKRPSSNGADLNVSAAFNLYAGGRQKALEAEQTGKKELASVATREQAATIGLQVVAQYLNAVRLNDQKRFIEEQVIRAETRRRYTAADSR
jgi:outer membrane protein